MKTAELEPGKSEATPTTAATEPSSGTPIEMGPHILNLKNILVPIDFSETSRKALQYAVPFAKQFGSRITLLHVVDFTMYPQELGYIQFDLVEMLEAQKKNLAELAERSIASELLSQNIVRYGIAWNTVIEVARETQADLIITTTHGYTGFKHVLLGSTAERIVRHAPCPVLVVREREHEFT
ncbi:MAG: Stress protein UspA-like protein [Chthoniobacteraceae bacterium]|nr:Stress protein UspA-like protein [Chthoniobacteraceae bacterium]